MEALDATEPAQREIAQPKPRTLLTGPQLILVYEATRCGGYGRMKVYSMLEYYRRAKAEARAAAQPEGR